MGRTYDREVKGREKKAGHREPRKNLADKGSDTLMAIWYLRGGKDQRLQRL